MGKQKKPGTARNFDPKHRGPRSLFEPGAAKHPRVSENPSAYNDSVISWHLGLLDYEGPFCPSRIGSGGISRILAKLKSFESMKWSEILNHRHHTVNASGIAPEAKQRLAELELEDHELLVSVALSNLERLWGIRKGAVMMLLWWDPEHLVFPSTKKDN